MSEINNNKTAVRLKILSHSFNYRDSAKTATVYAVHIYNTVIVITQTKNTE